jgi:hypothetical protein
MDPTGPWKEFANWLLSFPRRVVLLGVIIASGFFVWLGWESLVPHWTLNVSLPVFVLSVCFAIAILLIEAESRLMQIRRLHHLHADEKKILRDFLGGDGHAEVNNPKNIAWGKLVKDGILDQGEPWMPSDHWQFSPKPWVMPYLSKNPHLVAKEPKPPSPPGAPTG